MKKKHILLLGGHMSIAGGIYKAIESGESIHCTAIQVFTKSNRQWGGKEITEEDMALFKTTLKASCIHMVVAHATYLINLGSPKTGIIKKSIASLSMEVNNCEKLGISYLIVHPGSHVGSGEDACIKQIAESLDAVCEKNPGKTKILLETMAGQGTGVAYTFEHIARILNQAKHSRRLGVCFDTCHVFASGYDLRDKISYEKTMETFDAIVGLKKIKAFHINDSKKGLGSRVDRHEDIGKGKIGKKGFALLFNDERFFDVPKILETPEGTPESYKKNMDVIKSLLTEKTKKMLGVKQ